MAQDQQTITCPVGAWTQVTSGTVTALTLQALAGNMMVYGTTGPAPTADFGRVYPSGTGFENKSLTDLFYTAGKTTVWVKPTGGGAVTVYVDHA